MLMRISQRKWSAVAKKSSLGKGLGALMGETTAEVGSVNGSPTTLQLSRIKFNKNQPRKNFDEQSLEELADSIKQNGVLQPILVRRVGQNYEVIMGERRCRAAKLAGLKEIPVAIKDVDDEDVFKLAMIENLQRSDLNPIEEAQGYQKLIEDNDMTQEELGKALSKSRSSIANTLRLLDLPKEVQDLMIEGRLSAGHARAILAVPTEEGRIKLADKVVNENLTVRQTENLAPLISGNQEPRAKRQPAPQSFKRAARQLRLALDVPVKVKRVRNKNKIEIEFEDEDQLAQLVERLSELGMED